MAVHSAWSLQQRLPEGVAHSFGSVREHVGKVLVKQAANTG
jgi:hypothetical protein